MMQRDARSAGGGGMELTPGLVSVIVTVALAFVTAVVYVIRLEGRLNTMVTMIGNSDARNDEKFKSLLAHFESAIKAAIEGLSNQRKSDVELVNEKLGNLRNVQARHEQAIWTRMRGVERITGKAHVFNTSDEDDSGG
jgi:hypothetical protein